VFVGDRTEGQRETTADDPGTQPVMELKVSVCSRAAGSESRHQALGQAARGSGGVPIPGGVQTPWGCGTWGHGLAGMVGLG